jgi:branched-subunit amino acid transport protein
VIPEATPVWAIIAGLGVGSYLIRLSFLGLIGDRPLPPWLLRHLRYTAVAVMPALVAPLVAFPAATGGTPDAPRLAAAAATLAAGWLTRNVLAAIAAGGATLYGLLWLL